MSMNRRNALKSLAAGAAILGTGVAGADLTNPRPDFYKIVTKAIDANIMVYDSKAKQGEFTINLVHLLKKVMRDNAEHLSDELVNFNTIQPSDIWIPSVAKIDPKYTSVCGMKIHIRDDIAEIVTHQHGFLVGIYNGSHSHEDKYAVLLVDTTGVGLLGSF